MKRAKVILEKLGDIFKFEDFKDLFSKPIGSAEISNKETNNILVALENKSKNMSKNDRISSAYLYQTVANSLKRFLTSMSNDERFELKLPILNKNKIEIPFLDFIHITTCFFIKV